jgi:SAM-dependent methyltransferase
MFNSIWNFSDERRRLVQLLGSVDRNTSVLDVGCGYGRNLDLLQQLGFTRLTGVELNPHLAAEVRARGFRCLSPEQVEQEEGSYGMLLMSTYCGTFRISRPKGVCRELSSYAL